MNHQGWVRAVKAAAGACARFLQESLQAFLLRFSVEEIETYADRICIYCEELGVEWGMQVDGTRSLLGDLPKVMRLPSGRAGIHATQLH